MISDEERQRAAAHLPPVVYLPAGRLSGPEGPTVELRDLTDQRVALLAYTALDRLAECLGEQQPWLLFELDKLDEIRKQRHYDLLYFDLAIPETMWRGG